MKKYLLSIVMVLCSVMAFAQDELWVLNGKNVNPYNEEQYENLNETISVSISGSF